MGIDDLTLDHMANWFESLRSRQQPRCTVDEGFAHSVACIMAAQSYWSGKKQYWDAATETIQDHAPRAEQAAASIGFEPLRGFSDVIRVACHLALACSALVLCPNAKPTGLSRSLSTAAHHRSHALTLILVPRLPRPK